uniref:very-long-chain (3R)-3-hydroxyacyl-CoA dehydratase n=1 Tax=Oryza rufipogon TaxID=4529 RepID=A0A0E0MRE0_ORYRU
MRSGPGQIAFLQWLCLAQSGPVHQSRMIWARDSPTPYWTKRLRPLNQPSMKWSFLPLGQRSRMIIREPLRRGFDTVVTLVAWTIWKECNGRVFNQQQRTWVDIVKGMAAETALWRQANSAIPALILRRDFGSQNRPYSTFIVCFPVGMVCEVVLIYIALPFMEMKALQYQASEKSDKWSFSFNYFYANLFFMASFATATAQVATVSSANK